MAGDAEQEAGPREPDDRPPAQVTTIRKAIIIGALAALLVGAASSLATARLTDRQSDLDKQQVGITQLASQVSEQKAKITQLDSQVSEQKARIAQLVSPAGGGADEVDRLNAEIAALEDKVFALEAAKLTLEADKSTLQEQLSQILNPPSGPTPTAHLTGNWVQRAVGRYSGLTDAVVCAEIENTSDGDASIWYSSSQFHAIDGNNFVYPYPQYPAVSLDTPLDNGQLSPGEKRRGELLFDVPVETVLTGLVWNTGFAETPEIAVDLPAAQGTYHDPTDNYVVEC
jgi:cell division protein FtsL